MEDKIKRIIELAKQLKVQGVSNFEIAKYVHIELGKLIVYDNNYTIKNAGFDVSRDIEGKVSEKSVKRQERIINNETSISNLKQVCKGMAEIYAAILSEVGISANVVGVSSKEEVEGEKRDDGTIIHTPEKYKCNFDNNMAIKIGNKESQQDSKPTHWYCVVQTEKGEYIQDYLTEMALTRIKIGETNVNVNQLAGLHLKEEHRNKVLNSNVNINESFKDKVLYEYESYCKNNNDSNRAFDFIFTKLGDYISDFGFEEAKDFITLIGKVLPKGEITQLPNNINLVKEDKQHCQVTCIYQYNGKNYLVRSGKSDSKFPVGEISEEAIGKILEDGFQPRKLSDAKKLREMRNKEIKTISMESLVRNAITKGITIENVVKSEDVERVENQEKTKEGVTIDD